jgi:ribosomal protein S18 acetylase RimI-like enzyme
VKPADSVIRIRGLVPADAAAYQALRLSALRESPTNFLSSYEEECDRPVEAIAKSLEPGSGSTLFCAFAGGLLVGMIRVGREERRKERHMGFVRSMYVAPSHRGKGVGRRLLDHALAFAASMQGLRGLRLSVTAGNVGAIALYESAGFDACGVVPGALHVEGVYYDEITMVRPVDST